MHIYSPYCVSSAPLKNQQTKHESTVQLIQLALNRHLGCTKAEAWLSARETLVDLVEGWAMAMAMMTDPCLSAVWKNFQIAFLGPTWNCMKLWKNYWKLLCVSQHPHLSHPFLLPAVISHCMSHDGYGKDCWTTDVACGRTLGDFSKASKTAKSMASITPAPSLAEVSK